MMVAGTEPAALKNLPHVTAISNKPERYGVDVLWLAPGKRFYGVQRKEFPGDFIASVTDGRLAKERAQMKALDRAVLILEGRAIWMADGTLDTNYGQTWTRDSLRAYLASCWEDGIFTTWTDSTTDTASHIDVLYRWSQRIGHNSGKGRPGPEKRNLWGRHTNRDFQVHLLEGFPGIGTELAERILDMFGRVPLQWTATKEELMQVQGLGKKKVEGLLKTLGDLP